MLMSALLLSMDLLSRFHVHSMDWGKKRVSSLVTLPMSPEWAMSAGSSDYLIFTSRNEPSHITFLPYANTSLGDQIDHIYNGN